VIINKVLKREAIKVISLGFQNKRKILLSATSDVKNRKKPRRRSGNTVSSNSVRDLKHCMRSLFWSNQKLSKKYKVSRNLIK
jgi:hypothetical protein